MQAATFTKSLLVSAVLSLSSVSYAQQPNMNFAEIGYGQTSIDGDISGIDDFTGYNVAGSFKLSDSIYVPLTYYKHSGDASSSFTDNFGNVVQVFNEKLSLDIAEFSVGIGYKFSFSDTAIIVSDISYLQLKVSPSFEGNVTVTIDGVVEVEDFFSESGSSSEDGILVRSVYQQLYSNGFQLNAGLQYKLVRVDTENISDTGLIVEGLYHFTKQLSVKAGLSVADDSQYSISGRFSF